MPVSLCGETISIVSLVATRFHLVEGMCKLKTRTHMGKLAPTSPVATRFHLVEGMCKLENSHPHGRTCTHTETSPWMTFSADS